MANNQPAKPIKDNLPRVVRPRILETSNQKNKPPEKPIMVYAVLVMVFIGILMSIFKKNNDSTNSHENVQNEVKTNNESTTYYKCDICNSTINGKGYCRDDINGKWRECTTSDNLMPSICSYSCAIKKQQQIDNAWRKVDEKLEQHQNSNEDYYSKERERMRKQGYTEGEINQMRDPNKGDPEIQGSMERIDEILKNDH